MKFQPEHLAILKEKLQQMFESKGLEPNAALSSYLGKGLSLRRFVWDCFWATGIRVGDGVGTSSNCGIVGPYMDIHIETATKRALKELGADI